MLDYSCDLIQHHTRNEGRTCIHGKETDYSIEFCNVEVHRLHAILANETISFIVIFLHCFPSIDQCQFIGAVREDVIHSRSIFYRCDRILERPKCIFLFFCESSLRDRKLFILIRRIENTIHLILESFFQLSRIERRSLRSHSKFLFRYFFYQFDILFQNRFVCIVISFKFFRKFDEVRIIDNAFFRRLMSFLKLICHLKEIFGRFKHTRHCIYHNLGIFQRIDVYLIGSDHSL